MKHTSFTFFIAFFLIFTTIVVYGEPQNTEARSKARSKLTTGMRKKKNGITKAKLELTTVNSTTATLALNAEFNDTQSVAVEKFADAGEDTSNQDGIPTSTPSSTTQRPIEVTTKKRGAELEGCGECDQEDCTEPVDTTCPGLVSCN